MIAVENKPRAMSQAETAKQAALAAELTILASVGIPRESCKVEDVDIGDSETIHTIQIGPERIVTKENNNVLLMLHGYGAPACCFFRLLPSLVKEFHVILLDLPGMNFSSRLKERPFNCIDSCLAYCISRLERLINAMGLDYFSLIGHSIGGYLSGHLFARNKDRILKVIMLSPAGVNVPGEDELGALLGRHAGRNIFKRYFITNMQHHIFKHKQPPLLYFKLEFLRKLLVNFYVSNKRFGFTSEEKKALKTLSTYFLTLQPCGEYILCYLMHYGPKSYRPLIHTWGDLKDRFDDMLIVYGESDILDHQCTLERLADNKFNIKVTYIPKTDHQLIFQNVPVVTGVILNHLRKSPFKVIGQPQETGVPFPDLPVSPQKPVEDRVFQYIEEESAASTQPQGLPRHPSIEGLTAKEEEQLESEAVNIAARITSELIM